MSNHQLESPTTSFVCTTRSNPNPGEGSGMEQGNRRLQQTQAQVDEVQYLFNFMPRS